MNKEITKTQNEIIECQNRIKQLKKILCEQYYKYLESIGIKKGDVVTIKSNYYNKEKTGIFVFLEEKYGEFLPVVRKIKKDGTAHKTATLYIYNIKEMVKYVA